MKVHCEECGKVAFGSIESLENKGWHHASGKLNVQKFVASWCKEHFSPKKVLQLLKVSP